MEISEEGLSLSESETGYSTDNSDNEEQELEFSNKRKAEVNDANNKKQRVQGLDNHSQKNNFRHPPTAEEINHLRETENLYKSNLFRLQLEHLLSEVAVKQKYKNLFNTWFESFQAFLDTLPEYEIKSSDLAKTKKKLLREIAGACNNVNYKSDQDVSLRFVKPEQCHSFGLYKLNSTAGPNLEVNVKLSVPKMCFLEKDYLNNRFMMKCEYYLWYIFVKLVKTDLYSDLSCCPEKLCLKIVPNTSKKITVNVYISPMENCFKLSRFEPDKNNLRINGINDSIDTVKTPYYNSLALHFLTSASNYDYLEVALKELKNVQDAIKLLLVWLERRGLDKMGFHEELLSQTILYLVLRRKINNHMSSYQVIRNFWVFISTTNWQEQPVAICEDVKDEKIKLFKENFDVVFLDKSGSHNIAAFLHFDIYIKLKHEATMAVQLLDQSDVDPFPALFEVKMNPEVQYDALIRLSSSINFKNVYDNIKDVSFKAKYVGCQYYGLLNKILHMLKQGLNKRVVHIVPLKTKIIADTSAEDIYIGLTLNASNIFSSLEKGPLANSPEAVAFRKFWGNLSECRRFADGSICEAVYFPTETFQEKREVFKRIIDYVVKHKLKIKDYEVISNQLEEVITLKYIKAAFPLGTCEEPSLKAITTLDELSKKLKEFNLPLEITAVQGASEVLSYTELFPPIPTTYKWSGKLTTANENNVLIKEEPELTGVPRHVKCIECVIQLGINSKWPNDLKALRYLKIGFYLEVSKLLQQNKIITNVKPEYLDVFYKGLVFRLKLYNPKEISILKRYTKPDGVIGYKDNEESIEMETNLNIVPKLIGALNGLQSQNPSYGPSTVLIKRWLRSQMIDNAIMPDIVISLLNASLYLSPAPYTISNLPQLAFLRFLQYIMHLDWNTQMVIVNFNNELSKEVLSSLETDFQENRQNYSSLFIVTPFDEAKSVFSKKCTKEILKRVSLLAKATYNFIHFNIPQNNSDNFKELFIPNFEGYNVLIHLKPAFNSKRYQQLNILKQENSVHFEDYNEQQSTKMPVVNFNPIENYLQELRECYGHIALFFHDTYGGSVIAVLWKPDVLESKEFKVSHVPGRKLIGKKLTFSTSTILEDFYVLGNGLVETIEEKK